MGATSGADRFYNLVNNGFFNNARFFRVICGFMVQFGINADPKVSAVWRDANISDDPVKQSNTRGMITFATRGPNTRTTQMFINYADNNRLDGMGFASLRPGRLRHERRRCALQRLWRWAPRGAGPQQGRLQSEGNAYLIKEFPKLDYIKSATIVP